MVVANTLAYYKVTITAKKSFIAMTPIQRRDGWLKIFASEKVSHSHVAYAIQKLQL
jgi:hypothetical protein